MPASSNNTLHNFRQANSVRIDNIPDHANKSEIIALFNMLIGQACSTLNIRNATKNSMEISFLNRDAAARALRLSGYVVAGFPIFSTALMVELHSVVTAVQDPPAPRSKCSAEGRRNLYVLGLPFALTQTEFSTIFSRFGTVSHCVILATVDNSSRRRGFVVMSTHEEAERAMSALTRTQIKGCTLDISWAVVQRSQGFLDGGDRTMALEPHTPSDIHAEHVELNSANSSNSSIDSYECKPRLLTCFPSATLVVKNLPTLIFSEIQDLHPLLCPYGSVKKLELVSQPHQTCITALVEYSSVETAMEARESLQGQCYAGYELEARYIRTSPPADVDWNLGALGQDKPLNALATPFSIGPSQKFIPESSCSNTNMPYKTRNAQVPGDCPTTHRQGQLAAPPFSFPTHQPYDMSRANSAASIEGYTKGSAVADDLAFGPHVNVHNVRSPRHSPYLDMPHNAQDHYLYAW